MGFYVNPPKMSKEVFLEKYGKRITFAPVGHDFEGSDDLPVCWMHNGQFTAVGIAYCESELQAFNRPSDQRPKVWFLVPKKHLGTEAGMWEGWIEEAQKENPCG